MRKTIIATAFLSVLMLITWYMKSGTDTDALKNQPSKQKKEIQMDREQIWENPIPQNTGKRVIRTLPSPFQRISFETNGFYRPTALTSHPNGYIAFFDYGLHKIALVNTNNEYKITVIGDGQGKGPREFINPTGLNFDSEGTLWIADPKQARISRFTTGDQLLATLHMQDILPFRITASNNDLIILANSSTPGGILFHYDYHGNLINTIEPVELKTPEIGSLSEGEIFSFDGELYYALRHASLLRKYDSDLNLVYSRDTVDPITPARMETVALPVLGDAVGHRIEENSNIAALDIAADDRNIYLLYSGTEYHAYYYIDVYLKENGDYSFTIQLNHPASEFELIQNNLWVKEFIDQAPYLTGYRLEERLKNERFE